MNLKKTKKTKIIIKAYSMCLFYIPILFLASCQKPEKEKEIISFVLVEKFPSSNDTDINIDSEYLTARIYPLREIPLSFKVPGKIVKHSLATGKKVQEKEILAQLENIEQKIVLQQAQGNYDLQQVQLELAAKDLQRFTGLKQDGFISEAQLQQYETQFRIKEKQAKISQEQVILQKKLHQDLNLESPQSGIIRDFQVEKGQVIAAGQNVASLAVGKQIWVEVNENQLAALKLGQNANFYFNNIKYVLQIVNMSQTADAVSKRFLVKLDFLDKNVLNHDTLKIGLIGNLQFMNTGINTETNTTTGISFDVKKIKNLKTLKVLATALQMQKQNNAILWLVVENRSQKNTYVTQPQNVEIVKRLGEYTLVNVVDTMKSNHKAIGYVKAGGHLLKSQQIVKIYE